MSDVISWLESPAGEAWSRRYHSNNPILAAIKSDDEEDQLYWLDFGIPVWSVDAPWGYVSCPALARRR